MLYPLLKIPLHYSASDRVGLKRLEIKTQRLKSESSGDWQKERSNPKKKSLKKEFKKRV
ncbi:hypothetical protein VN1186_13140 [Helicobacter pylori]|nr:hypothetical protein VN1186_13140 [Helicobacter pylori]